MQCVDARVCLADRLLRAASPEGMCRRTASRGPWVREIASRKALPQGSDKAEDRAMATQVYTNRVVLAVRSYRFDPENHPEERFQIVHR